MKHKGVRTRIGDIDAVLSVNLSQMRSFLSSSSGVPQSTMNGTGLTEDVIEAIFNFEYLAARNSYGKAGIWMITAQTEDSGKHIWFSRGDGSKFTLTYTDSTSRWEVFFTTGSISTI